MYHILIFMSFSNILSKIGSGFSFDLGIDLGTANTVLYIRKKGVVLEEPSLVAINKKTKRIIAIGETARAMLGKTPLHIEILRPLKDGVIHDFEITQELIHHFLKVAETHITSWFQMNPRVLIGVPLNITNVELQSLFDAARFAGAKDVFIIEEPLAALLGAGYSILDPKGHAIIDVGGGTTDIAVVSLGNIVYGKSITTAGDVLNEAIQTYLRQYFKILVGIRTAEEIKIQYSNLSVDSDSMIEVRGKDVSTGLPHIMYVSPENIAEALQPHIETVVSEVKQILEQAPEEIISDIIEEGIILTGGGSMLRGLRGELEFQLGLSVHIPDNPLHTVAEGTGQILESLSMYEQILSRNEYDFTKKYKK